MLAPPGGVSAQQVPPAFDIYDAEGGVSTAILDSIAPDWTVSLASTGLKPAAGNDLIALRRQGAHLPPPPAKEQLVFQNGDRLSAAVTALTGEFVSCKFSAGKDQSLRVPLGALSLIWITRPDGVADEEAYFRGLTTVRRRRDAIILRNQDVIEGTLTSLNEKSLGVEQTRGKQLTLERSKVAVIALSTTFARNLIPRTPYAALVLDNGCRISLLSARLANHQLDGKTLFGAGVTIPLNEVAALQMRQGRASYLSDLKTAGYEYTPFLDTRWPYTLDSAVHGGHLHLGADTYDKGIGMHSESRLTYKLDGRYRWFESVVGLDARTGKQGSARIEVLVDGRVVFASKEDVTARSVPQKIRVDVANAQELTLVVKFGRYGDIGDDVDWADARLIK
jgi:hypothetical protein